MFRIISGKKFREIEKAVWDKAFSRGCQVGFNLAEELAKKPLKICITGRLPDSQVTADIDQILKEKGY